VVDLLDGAQELIVSGAADAQLARTAAADAELTQVAGAAARTAGIGQGLTTLCLGLAMWGAVVVGISAERAGHLNGVLLAVIALIPLAAFELVAGLPGATQTLQRVRRSATRVLEVIDSPPVVPEPLLPASPGPPPHALRVRGLRVRYPDRGRWALDGVDLDLGPGRRIAVVGPSGGGKSTLAGALLRLLPYQGGSVTLDGVEISELDGDQYRRVIGLVAQDAHIFDNTLEENLRLAHRDATENQLLAALDQVRLLDWALRLPAGLATEVGERGARMSGGQRQRLAVARALLADFPVLVLDEPGEHLDTSTADAIVADLLDVTRGRTTLLITHRLAGLEQIDEVLVLDGGRVVERGTHAELVGAGGRYARMWERELETRFTS
jgi:thiol reductant ABC exporter CydC subunit